MDLRDYETAVKEISKYLDFLPDDEAVRKNFIDMVAMKLVNL